MWEYRYTDELYHWEKKDHKYIEKKLVNGKWRYIYEDGSFEDPNDVVTRRERVNPNKTDAKIDVNYHTIYNNSLLSKKNQNTIVEQRDENGLLKSKDVYTNKGKIAQVTDAVKDKAKNAVDNAAFEVEWAIKDAKNTAGEAIGTTQKKRVEELEKSLPEEMAKRRSARKIGMYDVPGYDDLNKLRRKIKNAKQDYDETPLAKIEKAKKKVDEILKKYKKK